VTFAAEGISFDVWKLVSLEGFEERRIAHARLLAALRRQGVLDRGFHHSALQRLLAVLRWKEFSFLRLVGKLKEHLSSGLALVNDVDPFSCGGLVQ